MSETQYVNLQVSVKVIGIYCDEDKVRCAGPGENLRVRLSGIEEEDILSGFVLSSVGKFSQIKRSKRWSNDRSYASLFCANIVDDGHVTKRI